MLHGSRRSVAVALVVTVSLLGTAVAGADVGPGRDTTEVATRGASPAQVLAFEGFEDVPGGRYFTTPVNWAGASELTTGFTPTTFGPERAVTRAQFITWLWRLSGDDATWPSSGFPDVRSGAYYERAVDWAKANAITNGVDGGARFGVTDPITRSQILRFLWRDAGSPEGFPDSGLTDVNDGLAPAVNWGVAAGVTNGVGDTGRFEPLRGASRAESITMLYRSENRDLNQASTHAAHDALVRMNQIQVMGTHNSYRVRTPAALFDRLLSLRDLASGLGVDPYELDYGTRPLDQQLGRLGARQIELDVFPDPEGGLYADRVFNAFPGVDLPVASGESALDEPGYKVLHIQDLDYATHCLTFVACLEEVRDWSLANPSHLPITILVEVKTDPLPDLGSLANVIGGRTPAVPPEITSDLLDDLDAEINGVFGPGHLITPDDVRGGEATLREAVTTVGWPTLAESRGRIMLALDNAGTARDLYVDGRPSLDGRAMFADVGDKEADGAAFFKRNTPSDTEIPELVAEGFVVRTRADSPYVSLLRPSPGDPYAGVLTRRAAWASGATWLSSDYLERTDSTLAELRGNTYSAFLPAGGVARCNPVAVNPNCDDRLLLSDSFPIIF
jgi:hypothetical protein